jgi:hypothetical protein
VRSLFRIPSRDQRDARHCIAVPSRHTARARKWQVHPGPDVSPARPDRRNLAKSIGTPANDTAPGISDDDRRGSSQCAPGAIFSCSTSFGSTPIAQGPCRGSRQGRRAGTLETLVGAWESSLRLSPDVGPLTNPIRALDWGVRRWMPPVESGSGPKFASSWALPKRQITPKPALSPDLSIRQGVATTGPSRISYLPPEFV